MTREDAVPQASRTQIEHTRDVDYLITIVSSTLSSKDETA